MDDGSSTAVHSDSSVRRGRDLKLCVKRPLAGCCAGSHSPPKPVQSGFRCSDGILYCRPCFRQRFPDLHQARQRRLNRTCGLCGLERHFRGGFCRRCLSARGCMPDAGRSRWCAGLHRPRKPAQSGYKGSDGMPYCKVCYRTRYPKLHQAKLQKRKRTCGVCGMVRELLGGLCRPCKRARDPVLHQASLQKRKRTCGFCGMVRELLGGLCRPCKEA